MKILSFILLLILGLSVSAYVETCPDEKDISPCFCEEDDDSGSIEVVCDEFKNLEQLKKALNSLSGKENVNIVLMAELGTVPSNFFNGLHIKRLEIDHCIVDSLSDNGRPPLLGLEDSLEELTITGSFTEENVPTKLQFGHMRNLKELDISFNFITELGDDWFEGGPASLEYLMISNNEIEIIGSRAFADLINLKQLSFDGNRFGPIRRSMLPSPAESLETLELDNNALTSIPEDLFSGMPALTGVSLGANGILRLDQRAWQPVWKQLQYLELDGNTIECDSSMDWIITSKILPIIYGICHAPPEVEGEDIEEYLHKRMH